jgi:hypothetical protein
MYKITKTTTTSGRQQPGTQTGIRNSQRGAVPQELRNGKRGPPPADAFLKIIDRRGKKHQHQEKHEGKKTEEKQEKKEEKKHHHAPPKEPRKGKKHAEYEKKPQAEIKPENKASLQYRQFAASAKVQAVNLQGNNMLSANNITMMRTEGEHFLNNNAPMKLDQEDDASLLFETTRLNPGDRESSYVDEGRSLPLTPLVGSLNSVLTIPYGTNTTVNYQVFIISPTFGYARNNSGYAQFTRQFPTEAIDLLPTTGVFPAFQSNVSAFGGNVAVFSDLFFAYAQRLDVTIGMPDSTSAGYVYMGSRPLSAFKNSSSSAAQITVADLVGAATVVQPAQHNQTYSIRGAVKNTKCINTVYSPPDASSTTIGWNEIAEERVWYMIIYKPALSLTTNTAIDVTMNTCMKYNAVYSPDGKITPLVQQSQKTAVVTENPTPSETLLSSNIATLMCDPEPQEVGTLNQIIRAVTSGSVGKLESVISEAIAGLASEPMALAVAGALMMQCNEINYDHARVETLWWTMGWIYPKLYTPLETLPRELADLHESTLSRMQEYTTTFRDFLDRNPINQDGTLSQNRNLGKQANESINKGNVKMFR